MLFNIVNTITKKQDYFSGSLKDAIDKMKTGNYSISAVQCESLSETEIFLKISDYLKESKEMMFLNGVGFGFFEKYYMAGFLKILSDEIPINENNPDFKILLRILNEMILKMSEENHVPRFVIYKENELNDIYICDIPDSKLMRILGDTHTKITATEEQMNSLFELVTISLNLFY